MASKIRISQVLQGTALQKVADKTSSNEWTVDLTNETTTSRISLRNPFATSIAVGVNLETEIKWYLENYVNEPFDTTRADAAYDTLSGYGCILAAQLALCSLLPTYGDIELEISGNFSKPTGSERTLQQIHWEILEDIKVWPSSHKFKSVSVFRSMTVPEAVTAHGEQLEKKSFRILLVVSRPSQENDLDFQLVSRCLVAIIDYVSRTSPCKNASLRVLRPPTWQAFQEHLQEYDYDLVHLDMHGQIRNRSKGSPTAVLAFCKLDILNPLRMKKDLKTGIEVGKELAKAGVKTVILNACESASFQYSTPESNLAEVILAQGVNIVLAMAYKVVDEAVETFINTFYQSLLVHNFSVQEAARASRLALMKHRSRRARFMHNVQLSDHIVPVLYKSSSPPGLIPTPIPNSPRRGMFSYMETILSSMKNISPFERIARSTMIETRQDLIGRDLDILALEMLLSVSRVVLLHGSGGCGKSELLSYACKWWKQSGWVKCFAKIDFADIRLQGNSYSEIIKTIGKQLDMDPGHYSESDVVGKLRSGRYILVFDSAECFDTPSILETISAAKELPSQLNTFIEAATCDRSMVIISSRQDTVPIFKTMPERQKYHLGGLSVLDSVNLLQQTVFIKGTKVPEMFHRRENIDFIRRVVILLEGNPAAIQIIGPAFKKAKFDGKALLNTLLYGCIEEDDEAWKECRFYMTVSTAMMLPSFHDSDKTMIDICHLSIFWTLLPRDLTWFYWFLYIEISKYFKEASYANWISQELKDIVKDAQMARALRTHWPALETKLLKVGILQRASIQRKSMGEKNKNENLACYHIHPIFTLIGRTRLNSNPEALRVAKFAYIRQVLLWHEPAMKTIASDFVAAEWDGTEQHEDYIHNIRAVAMSWSIDDGDLQEEVSRMGMSLFDLVHSMSLDSFYASPRQLTLFVPLLWKQLLRVHMLVALIRPNAMPDRRDMDSILTISWELCRLRQDDENKLSVVNNALDVAASYKLAGNLLNPPVEFSWFQLCHGQARLTEANDIYMAKRLYERNLETDPLCSPSSEHGMYNAIRRLQLQNITDWAACVQVIAAREGKLDKETASSNIRGFINELAPNGMADFMANIGAENGKLIENMPLREQFSLAIEQEKEAVAKFGTLTQHILNNTMGDVFADTIKSYGHPEGLFGMARESLSSDNRQSPELKAIFESIDAGLHVIAGNITGATSALTENIEREALSSTDSTSWSKIAELHMQMYGIAVMSSATPDYRKGLTHLEEWWKVHQGIDIPKRELCYGHLKFAICYNALDRVADAARSVLKCLYIIPTMKKSDFPEKGDVESFSEWQHGEFASLDKLLIFLDPRIIPFPTPSVADLAWQERVLLYQAMKKGAELQRVKQDLEDSQKGLLVTLEKYKKTMARLRSLDSDSSVLEENEKSVDEMIKRQLDKRSDHDVYWLG